MPVYFLLSLYRGGRSLYGSSERYEELDEVGRGEGRPHQAAQVWMRVGKRIRQGARPQQIGFSGLDPKIRVRRCRSPEKQNWQKQLWKKTIPRQEEKQDPGGGTGVREPEAQGRA